MSEQRSILIATPAIDGKRKKASELAVQCAMLEASGLGWSFEEFIRAQDSIIPQARNVLLGKFLASNHTDMLWLDSDVGFGPGVFTRLMTHRVDMVAAVPRVKSDDERYPVRWLSDLGQMVDPLTGLRLAEGVPFGCVRITRALAERLRDAYAEQWFRVGDADHQNWCIFDTMFRAHQYWGEDFIFCERVRAIGASVHVDAEIRTVHVGRDDKPYSGHLGDYLRRQVVAAHPIDAISAALAGGADGASVADRLRELFADPKNASMIGAALDEPA